MDRIAELYWFSSVHNSTDLTVTDNSFLSPSLIGYAVSPMTDSVKAVKYTLCLGMSIKIGY